MRTLLALTVVSACMLPGQAPNEGTRSLRLLGELPARLERARPLADGSTILTLLVETANQPIDRGDRIEVFDPATGVMLSSGRVTRDTRADRGSGRVHVRVKLTEANDGPTLARRAPDRQPGFPDARAKRDAFVRAHGPKVTIVLPFEPEDGDDPANFVRVIDSGTKVGTVGTNVVRPHVSFELRFDKRVDVATLRRVQMQMPSAAAAGEVPMRILATNEEGTRFRFEPPLGLPFHQGMRAKAQKAGNPNPHFHLRIAAHKDGLRATNGDTLAHAFDLPISIDPNAKENLVTWRTLRGR